MQVLKNRLHFNGTWLLVVLCASLFSSASPGGDVFEIHVNNKMVIRQVLHMDKSVKVLDLSGYSNDVLSVYYNECGRNGTSRSLSLKDGQKTVRTWRFEDTKEAPGKAAMSCRINDILGAMKSNQPGKLNLVYASSAYEQGQVLVTFSSDDVKASRK